MKSTVSTFLAGLSLAAVCLVATIAPAGNEGTLPLRLGGNEGTMPLRLSGEALSLTGGNRVITEIVITRAIQTALPAAQAGSLTCQANSDDVSKHSASGTIHVATLAFTIKGICYNHATQAMEVVAERTINGTTVERSFVAAALTQEQPRALSGRLTVTGRSSTAGRYQLDVQAP